MMSTASATNNCYGRLHERIDEFESEMLQMIKNVVSDAREKLHRFMDEQMNDMRLPYDGMTDELDLICDEDYYYESDLNRLRSDIDSVANCESQKSGILWSKSGKSRKLF
jgi:hypothetical protein